MRFGAVLTMTVPYVGRVSSCGALDGPQSVP